MTYTSKSMKRPPFYIGAHRRRVSTGVMAAIASALIVGTSLILVGACAATVAL